LDDKCVPNFRRSIFPDWYFLPVNGTRNARECREWHLAEGDAAILLIFRLQRAGEILVRLIRHHIELVDSFIEHALAILVDRQAKAATNSCRFFMALLVSLSVQIWKTFGLSHPSRKAE
jgi:hypothetical protein